MIDKNKSAPEQSAAERAKRVKEIKFHICGAAAGLIYPWDDRLAMVKEIAEAMEIEDGDREFQSAREKLITYAEERSYVVLANTAPDSGGARARAALGEGFLDGAGRGLPFISLGAAAEKLDDISHELKEITGDLFQQPATAESILRQSLFSPVASGGLPLPPVEKLRALPLRRAGGNAETAFARLSEVFWKWHTAEKYFADISGSLRAGQAHTAPAAAPPRPAGAPGASR